MLRIWKSMDSTKTISMKTDENISHGSKPIEV